MSRVTQAELRPEEEESLWASHRVHGDADARAKLCEHYHPTARIIAAKLFAKRSQRELEFQDYLQFALIGLLESIDRFDPMQGVRFVTYAGKRIQGAVLDGVATLSEFQEQGAWRSEARKQRAGMLARNSGAERDDADPFEALADIAIGLALGYMLEGSGMIDEPERPSLPDPYVGVELRQLQDQVTSLLTTLPQNERVVLQYHYLFHIPFESVAQMLGLSLGRISQLHHGGLRRLREAASNIRRTDLAW